MILDLVKLKGLSDLDEAYFDSPAFNTIRIHAGGGELCVNKGGFAGD